MTNSEPKFDLTDVILCEDIRKEDNGKVLLIGIFSGHILVSEFPAPFPVCLWLNFKTNGVGEVKREFRIINVDGDVFAHGEFGTRIVAPDGHTHIPLKNILLSVPHKGELKFQIRVPKGRWKTVLSKMVYLESEFRKVNPSQPISLPQPSLQSPPAERG